MKLIAKITVRPDAPLHIYTNMSHMRWATGADSPPTDDAGIFAPNDLPKFELDTNGFQARTELNLDLADNPLVKGHHTFACNIITVTLERDFAELQNPLEKIANEYSQTYLTTLHVLVNRLTAYLRYRIGNPFLRRLNAGHIEAWEWFNHGGELIHSESRGLIVD